MLDKLALELVLELTIRTEGAHLEPVQELEHLSVNKKFYLFSKLFIPSILRR